MIVQQTITKVTMVHSQYANVHTTLVNVVNACKTRQERYSCIYHFSAGRIANDTIMSRELPNSLKCRIGKNPACLQ